ncbi:MAG: GNAT family N-acetyltransferase, partial [Deltaproteobacteria bacterium]|nr:GNAT family N-acetyltransferase [Deltaproteobacteria bacterium]
MTRAALELREGGDADEAAIVELLRASLGEGQIPRTAEFFRWKHREGPFGPSPCRVALAGERLVGVRLFLRWRFRDGDRVVEAVRAVDTATHPEFQGQGIFSKLTLGLVADETARGTGFVFNTPNEKSRPGYLKMGWESLGRITLWVRPGPGAVREGAARLLGRLGAGGAPPGGAT